ncbi:MAG: porin [Burkholderiales bacterium]|nr:porin [Burkholderiales bacterium]
MKKSLLALAVLGAAAGAAQAQSNVTIYGVVDMALQHQNTGEAAGSTVALDSGIQSGSRLGFKGSEDLGSGLKANFQLEMGVNADTGKSAQGGLAFGRQAWVGLSGDFGALNFGRQYTPAFIAIDSFDPFGTGLTTGTAGSGTSSFGAAHFFGGPSRVNNAVSYSSNNLGGFTANAFYGLGEVAGNATAGRYLGLSGAYNNGPLFATLVYTNAQNAAGDNAKKSILLAGTYNFGMATAHAAFSTIKDDGVAAAAVDARVWLLGVSVPVGAGTVSADYIRYANRNALVADANANHLALGYSYALSKRTNLYTSISRTANDANATMGSDDSSAALHPVAAGANVRMFNVGIRHKF